MNDFLPRAAAAELEVLLGAMPVVVVTGARQTGKSTMVQESPALRNHLLLDLDDVVLRTDAERDPAAFIRRADRVAIDEVQRVPALLTEIKRAVDAERQRVKGRFVLTGSANLLMMASVGESLAGRAGYLSLAPMTRRELLGFGTTGDWGALIEAPFDVWSDRLEATDAPPADWRDVAQRGGFPVPAFLEDGRARDAWFRSYLTTYLERDLRDVSAVDSLGDFQRAMRAFALRAGTPVNHADVARDLGLVARTLRRWLDLLVMTFQMTKLPAYSVRRSARLRKRPKHYWNDSALMMRVAGGDTPAGVHLETLVLNDLRAWAALDSGRPVLHYWRDEENREVDFVIERDDSLLAIEVKATERPRADDWRHLQHFVAQYDRECVGALLLHGGTETFRAADRILALPWWRIL